MRLPIAAFVAALLLLSNGLAGCARNPVTGRPEAVLTSEAGEISQGEEAAKEIEEQFGLLQNPDLDAYVRDIGRRLVANAPRQNLEYRFYVVEMTEPNAFALPGGHIYVSRGLLALLNSEDELAGVIGHEIGHVAARHSVARQTRSAPLIPVQIAAGLGGMAASIVSPRLGSLIAGTGQLPGALAMASYSRNQEREADRLGQDYAAAAGWSPAALGDFMNTLAREEKLAGHESGRLSFLASHPSSPERSEASLEYAQTLTPAVAAPIATSRADFLKRLDGIVVDERAAEGIFIESRFIQPDMDFGLSFPKDWKLQNSRSAVTAQHPEETGILVLRLAATGNDPVVAANTFARENKLRRAPTVLQISGFQAARIETESGSMLSPSKVYVVWIAKDGLVYQIAGVCTASRYEELRPVFESTTQSFHALSEAERAGVRELRLRVETARAGESLEQLLERSKNAWDPAHVAVANGVEAGAKLEAGARIKIARSELYVPPPREAAADAAAPGGK